MEDSQQNSSPSKSEPPNDPGKMFIGGLSANTTAESLRAYFSTFGEIKEAMVMRDPVTKRSRGFGFVTFTDPVSVDKVRERAPHTVDDRTVDAKVAVPKRPQPKMVTRTKKIFVGGLSPQTTLEDLKNYFEREFGKTTDAMIMFDKTTQRSRGFGFVTFETEDIVEEICKTHYHNISGKKVEAKKAQPKEVMFPQLRGRGGRGFWPCFGYHPELAGYGRGFGPGFGTPGYGFPFHTAFNHMAAYHQAAGRGRGRERYLPPGYPGNPGFAGYPPYMNQGHRARASHGQYYTDYARPQVHGQGPRGEPQAPVNSLQTDYADYSGVQMNPPGNFGPQQAGFGPPPPSPVNRGFAPATSPGPAAVAQDLSGYMASAGAGGNSGGSESMGYSAGSPQPSAFGPAAIANWYTSGAQPYQNTTISLRH